MSGYFCHYRKIQEWEWRSSPNHFSVFMYCLERANFKDQKFKGRIVKRGSFLTSHDQISEKTGVKKRSVRAVLNDLKKSGEIVTKSSRQGTEITVKNWDQYNNDVTKHVTKDVTKAVALTSTIKKEKKEKNNIYSDSIKKIVEHLNNTTGQKYRANSKKTIQLITARLNEGFVLDEFIRVINIKSDQWLYDAKMKSFLRPETLFGNKFEGYLNESSVENPELKAANEALFGD